MDTSRLKQDWRKGFQIMICGGFAVSIALAPTKILEMVIDSGDISTASRVISIIAAVIYTFTLGPIFTTRILKSIGFRLEEERGVTQKEEAK